MNGDSDILEKLWKRQEMAVEIWSKANDIDTLMRLFDKVADTAAQRTLEEMERVKENQMDKVRKSNDTIDIKKSNMVSIDTLYESARRKTIKFYIRKYYPKLMSMRFDATSDEGIALKYLYFNPHMVIIFEDMGAALKKEAKNKTLQELFFQGRWKFITSFFLFQDTTNVPPALRKNAFIKIFCAQECVISYFNAKNNGIGGKTRKITEIIGDKIFSKTPGCDNFKKLVYIRESANKIQYGIADVHSKFEMGSPHTRDMGEKIENEESIDTENDFYANFFS